MAGIDLSTAGTTMQYAVEATAGTRPTSGYKLIHGVKSVPSFNEAPETIETTTLEATMYKTYVAALKDPGGSLAFNFNLTQLFIDTWTEIIAEYDTAAETNKKMWFAVVIPGITKAFYFSGKPEALGLPAIEVSSVLETEAFITPVEIPGWDTKPTTI